jgi:hypothetical protein
MDSRRTSCAAGSRLDSIGGGGSSSQLSSRAVGTRQMWMEMHDNDCSAYCLSGTLEPHKLWFGVGMHRCVMG